MYSIEGARSIMGTSVTITVVHTDVGEAKEAVRCAFDEMSKISDLLSVYKEKSEVSALNRNGLYERASAELIEVIERASYYSELSDGAFDVTVLPVLDLWEEKLGGGKVPTSEEIDKALGLVNYKNIAIEKGGIRFKKKGMGITLAGIAKGYVVDKAIEALKQKNIRHALVNAGGDIRVIGTKVKGAPWRVAVRDPQNKRESITIVKLRDRAIATSGCYERYLGKEAWARRQSVSHVINSKTGQPVQGPISSTVVAKKAIDTDTLATIILIVGTNKGMELIERLDGVEALVITDKGKVIRSGNFQRYESSR